MSVEIPDLWPRSIQVDIRAPLPVLRAQGEKLAERTKGILEGSVETVTLADGEHLKHQFQIFAPALGSHHNVLTAEHPRDMPYPVKVGAACFSTSGWNPTQGEYSVSTEPGTGQRKVVAPTEPLFLKLVQQVFASLEVQSLIDSLIARSNEVRPLPREEGD